MKRIIVAAIGLGAYLFAAGVSAMPASPPSPSLSPPDAAPLFTPAPAARPTTPSPVDTQAWCYDSYWGWYYCSK